MVAFICIGPLHGIRRKFKTNIRLLKLERKTKGGGGQVPELVKRM